MAAIPIRSKADHTPAATVAPGGAVPGPAKSNPGNRKEKRYLIFVQNRESEKIFSISCEAEKAVIHCRLRYRYLRVEDTDKPYPVRSRKWISPEKYQFPTV